MAKQFDGGSAFPGHLVNNQGRIDSSRDHGEEGMSMRDYFAAKAMRGMLANPVIAEEQRSNGFNGDDNIKMLAQSAFAYADAMLKARVK